ncbi:MAG: NTP transferase domain-containing protein [Burkholderiaceae bacterium]|nr:NTP transferase domain-containing protein [Burkholderiaceae bacterium]
MRARSVALVQARMGSSRFPGKMLAPLGGLPLLHWVLARLQRSQRLDAVVLATSELPRDRPLVALAQGLGVASFAGSETDVLGRFAAAAEAHGARRVVRVCADNPFVCPGEVDRLLGFFDHAGADYACNHLDRLGSGYADGFGAEVLDADLLQRLHRSTTLPRHREHVTLYLWDHAADFRLAAPPAPPALAHPALRFDVDQPEHLAALEALRAGAGLDLHSTAVEVVAAALRRGWGRPPLAA